MAKLRAHENCSSPGFYSFFSLCLSVACYRRPLPRDCQSDGSRIPEGEIPPADVLPCCRRTRPSREAPIRSYAAHLAAGTPATTPHRCARTHTDQTPLHRRIHPLQRVRTPSPSYKKILFVGLSLIPVVPTGGGSGFGFILGPYRPPRWVS
jgi:hypothetical protein